MSIDQLFESGERKQDKGHFKNLVLVANADGIITKEENDLLNRIGKELGLSSQQIEHIKKNSDDYEIIPPISKIERLEQFVNLLEMVQVDGEIDDNEYYLLETLAVVLGFKKIQDINIDKALFLISKGYDSESIAEIIVKKQ